MRQVIKSILLYDIIRFNLYVILIFLLTFELLHHQNVDLTLNAQMIKPVYMSNAKIHALKIFVDKMLLVRFILTDHYVHVTMAILEMQMSYAMKVSLFMELCTLYIS